MGYRELLLLSAMTTQDALLQLKRGNSIDCITPRGTNFQIRSKLSHGIAFYRAFPARKGTLNRFSRLSDDELLQWLESVTITT
jgi:hypothetical protein